MRQDQELPLLTIADTALALATEAGAPEAFSRPNDADEAEGAARADCRQAEALLHQGFGDAALECCRRAMPHAANDPAMLHICAWVFSNCRCHNEAATAYRAQLRLTPDWTEGHRHASGALAAAGRLDDAIPHAIAASDGASHSAEFAFHAGALLLEARRLPEAVHYLERTAALEPGNPRIMCALAAAYCDLDHIEAAAALALRAAAIAPDDPAGAVDAAELLLRCGRPDVACKLLSDVAAINPDPRLFRVLSTAEMLQGRLHAALAAVDRAIDAAPDCAEYHLHRGHLLWRLDDLPGAARCFERAAALDPANRDLKRAQLSLFLASGLTSEATAVGGELLQRFPDDKPAAEAVLHLLNHRLDTIDGEYLVLSEQVERGVRAARQPRAGSIVCAARAA